MADICDATASMFVEHEESVVPLLEPPSVAHSAVTLRHWRLDARPSSTRGSPGGSPPIVTAYFTKTGIR